MNLVMYSLGGIGLLALAGSILVAMFDERKEKGGK